MESTYLKYFGNLFKLSNIVVQTFRLQNKKKKIEGSAIKMPDSEKHKANILTCQKYTYQEHNSKYPNHPSMPVMFN